MEEETLTKAPYRRRELIRQVVSAGYKKGSGLLFLGLAGENIGIVDNLGLDIVKHSKTKMIKLENKK